jgi:DNA-directed RNA polymerase specialized sigma24 family protein
MIAYNPADPRTADPAVKDALNRLTEAQAMEIIDLHENGGLAPEEIANRFSIPVECVWIIIDDMMFDTPKH